MVKFKGTWVNGSSNGHSESTAYFDRTWGVLLEVEGAHGTNKCGDHVILIEFKP